MTAAEIKEKAVSRFDDLLEMLLDVWTKEELAGVTRTLGLQIKGFTKKIENAPINQLKIKIRRAKLQHLQLSKVFQKYYEGERNKHEELDEKQFLFKIMQNETLSDAECLILVYYGCSEWYEENKGALQNNICAGQALFAGLTEQQSNREDWLYVLSRDAEEQFEQLAGAILVEEDEKKDGSFKEWLNMAGQIQNSESITGILKAKDEWSTWPVQEQLYVMKMLSASLLSAAAQTNAKLAASMDKNEELTKQLKEEQACTSELRAALNERNNDLVSLHSEYQHKVQELEASAQTLKEELHGHKRQLSERNQIYKAELAGLKKELEEARHNDCTPLFPETFWLITNYEPTLFEGFLQKEQIMQTEEFVREPKKFQDCMLFLHTTGLSTVEQFEIEEKIREVSHLVCFINGTLQEVVRKMAYYLEGEWKYEA